MTCVRPKNTCSCSRPRDVVLEAAHTRTHLVNAYAEEARKPLPCESYDPVIIKWSWKSMHLKMIM